MKLSYLYPLFGFIVPTVVFGYGLVIPKSCIAGMNDRTKPSKIFYKLNCLDPLDLFEV